MPNHLTPDELSKEVGIERDEVIRICVEEHVPIYQGKIDKTLFQAQLEALGATARSRPSRQRSRGARGGLAALALGGRALARGRLRRGACFAGPASRRAASSPRRPRRAAPPSGRRPARARRAPGSVISSPGELRLEQAPERRAVLAVQLRRVERRRERRDDLLRELELRRRTSAAATASSISAWSCTSSWTNSVSSASASPSGRIRHSFSLPARTNRPSAATSPSFIAASSSTYGRRAASVPAGTR